MNFLTLRDPESIDHMPLLSLTKALLGISLIALQINGDVVEVSFFISVINITSKSRWV